MADYAVQADMEAVFGEAELLIASDRDGDGVVDPLAIASALTKASSEMNSYIGVVYDLPLTSANEHLERLCCDIAMYVLSADSGALTEEKRTRYEDAVLWLGRLANGKATLGLIEEDEVAGDEAEVTLETQDRLFTRTTMQGLF